MSDLVGNPVDRFSHNEAHIKTDFFENMLSSKCIACNCLSDLE